MDTNQQQTAPQAPVSQEVSDEQVMAGFLGQPLPQEPQQAERPRDAQGRFLPQQAQQPAEAQQPAQPEQQAEQKPAAEQPAEEKAEPQQEEVKWDEVKDIKLKIPMKNGEKEWEEEITLHDLREGHMMRQDYLKKTQELATQRREVESATQQAVEKERAQYLTALQALHQSVLQAAAPELANVDWSRLAQENPGEYVRLSNRAREVNQALERVQYESEKVRMQQEKERGERLSKAVDESRAKLKEAIPNWDDGLYQSLLKRTIDTYGFTHDEVKEVFDHRIWKVIHDAHQFHLLNDGKKTVEKKVVNVPPVLKPGAQQQRVNPQTQQLQNATEALRKRGNDIDAAAAVMASFISPVRR